MGALASLIGLPCRVRDVRVGEVAGVYVDTECTRVLGLDIRSPGDVRRFLPWVAAEIGAEGVSVHSVFLLVDAGDSYARLGARELADATGLEGLRVDAAGRVFRHGPVSTARSTGISSR